MAITAAELFSTALPKQTVAPLWNFV